MHVSDPLFVLAPTFDHRHLGFLADIKDPDGTVAVACAEDVPGDLIRGQGGDAGAGAGGNILR